MGRRLLPIVLVSLGVVILARALLPGYVERRLNAAFADLDGHTGHVEDLDLALWKGAVRLEAVTIDRDEAGTRKPLLRADAVALRVRWRELLRGALVGELDLHRPRYFLEAAPPAAPDDDVRSGTRIDWGGLADLAPFQITRFEVHGGELAYHDPHAEPPVSIALRQIRIFARDWGNRPGGGAARPAYARASARAFRSAGVFAELDADPLAPHPDFALRLRSEGIELAELNEFLRAYAGLDVAAGRLDVFFEVAAADGAFEGYLKPLVRDLDVSSPADASDSWTDRLWEAAAGGVAELFENQPEDQQGSRIPLEGRFSDPDLDLVGAIGSLLRNAFIEALPAQLEGAGRGQG